MKQALFRRDRRLIKAANLPTGADAGEAGWPDRLPQCSMTTRTVEATNLVDIVGSSRAS